MKCLVTGGAGFIGSNLVEELIKKGHKVVVLDNFFLGIEKNLERIRDKIELVDGDIRDLDLLLKITKGVDVIFNQAAASSSPMFRENLKEALSVNIDGFIHILNAARINNVKRVVYASTSSIYGNTKALLREDMKVVPVNFYASSKLMNEHLAALYGIEYGLETVGLRYMSVYGPHEEGKTKFANLVTQFLWAMKKDERPVIYGTGEQTRDFIYVKDICQANILAAATKKKMIGEIFNVGTGKATSLNDLVKMLNSVLNKKIQPKYVKNTVKNYIDFQKADVSKITKSLGYKPEYSIKRGLEEIIAM
ncbi:MAG: SDR family NAD(P)-dependent oxidoreductase [Candidatus Aenigmarchaeota archaeon]|nr:SDR family NAD(P)-dependent oxidoreductase [Candidatus Aenigmarchaeota archaeon]